MCVHVCMWRTWVNIRYTFESLSTWFFESGRQSPGLVTVPKTGHRRPTQATDQWLYWTIVPWELFGRKDRTSVLAPEKNRGWWSLEKAFTEVSTTPIKASLTPNRGRLWCSRGSRTLAWHPLATGWPVGYAQCPCSSSHPTKSSTGGVFRGTLLSLHLSGSWRTVPWKVSHCPNGVTSVFMDPVSLPLRVDPKEKWTRMWKY